MINSSKRYFIFNHICYCFNTFLISNNIKIYKTLSFKFELRNCLNLIVAGNIAFFTFFSISYGEKYGDKTGSPLT